MKIGKKYKVQPGNRLTGKHRVYEADETIPEDELCGDIAGSIEDGVIVEVVEAKPAPVVPVAPEPEPEPELDFEQADGNQEPDPEPEPEKTNDELEPKHDQDPELEPEKAGENQKNEKELPAIGGGAKKK